MRQKKKARTGRGREQEVKEQRLDLCLVVQLSADASGLDPLLEAFRKSRRSRADEFELCLIGPSPSALDQQYPQSHVLTALKEKNKLHVLPSDSQKTETALIQEALTSTSAQNILLVETQGMDKSFNMEDFFRIKESSLVNEQVVLPIFRGQEAKPGQMPIPLMLFRRELLEYLLTLKGHTTTHADLFHSLERLEIKAGLHNIPQQFPYVNDLTIPRKSPWIPRPGSFISWFFRIPLTELRTRPHRKYTFLKLPSWYRMLFVASTILIAIILPLLSLDAGQSGDDEKHYEHAKKVYNYFKTDGEDKAALEPGRLKLNYYGQSLDLLTYVINKTFRIEKEYEARHFIIALTGVLAILFAGLLAVRLAGWRAGFFTLIMMFLAPRFLGHAMNNPLDVPFAFGYIFTIYHVFGFLRKLPAYSNSHAFWMMIGIAFTVSIRIGGLILVPLAGLFAGLYVLFVKFPFKSFSAPWFRMVFRGAVYLAVIALGSYLLSLLPWPYGREKPFENPFNALEMMSNISVAIRVLFNGAIHWSNKLPWNYISMNILFTVPLLILVSFFLYPFIAGKQRREIPPVLIFSLYFAVVFPIAYVIYKESNVYGGWRHLMFVFPPMAVLAGLGLDNVARRLKRNVLQWAIAGILLIGILHPLIHIAANPSLSYIYFNELLGLKKAYGRFETDYYLHSLKPGAEWLAENVLEKKLGTAGQNAGSGDGSSIDTPGPSSEADKPIIVATNGSVSYYLRHFGEKVRPLYTRYYDRGQYDWDYAVYYCNYIDPYQLKNGLWPPEGTIHTIDVKGIPVCAIVERESKEDYEAISLIRRRDLMNGIPALVAVNHKYPKNEIVKLRLGEAYIETKQFQKVHEVVAELLEIYPEYDKALNLKGVAYLQSGDLENAIKTFQHIIRINYRFASAYHNLGLCYINFNPPEVDLALESFQKAIDVNAGYKPAYQAIASILHQMGRTQEARQYQSAADAL